MELQTFIVIYCLLAIVLPLGLSLYEYRHIVARRRKK